MKSDRKLRSVIRMLKRVWHSQNNPKALMVNYILLGVTSEVRSLISMLLPAIVVQILTEAPDMFLSIGMIASICIFICIFNLILEKLQVSISMLSGKEYNYRILNINQKYMRLDLKDCEDGNVMDLLDKAYEGVGQTDDVIYIVISSLCCKFITLGVSLFIFIRVNWGVLCIVLLSTVINLLLENYQAKREHRINNMVSPFMHKKTYLEDVMLDFSANKEIRLFHARHLFVEKYDHILHKIFDFSRKKRKLSNKMEFLYGLIECLSFIAVYCIAIFRFAKGLLPISEFVLFTSASEQTNAALWNIKYGISYLIQACRYDTDVEAYMALPKTDLDTGDQMLHRDLFTNIKAEHLSFQYRNQDKLALKDVSFSIHRGEKIAVVGDNGAGKSTMIKILQRLYLPEKNMLYINGQDVRSYLCSSYQSLFATVYQDYMTYAYTVKENISFDSNCSDTGVWEALKKANLYDKVHKLNLGIHTPYTKRFYQEGVEFSGGEEQRLAIARAFYRDAPIMIFDEPTAALDPINEHKIYREIYNQTEEKTVIYIFHRLSTTKFCDRIFVFHDGHIVETGTHAELMKQNGIYRDMFDKQASYYR